MRFHQIQFVSVRLRLVVERVLVVVVVVKLTEQNANYKHVLWRHRLKQFWECQLSLFTQQALLQRPAKQTFSTIFKLS
jgi:hypothetical protein